MTRILGGERARLSEMVELAPCCMVVVKGPELRIEAANPAAARLFDLGEVRDRAVEEVLGSDVPLVEGLRAAYREDRVWTSGPRTIVPRAGDAAHPRTLLFTVVPTHDEEQTDGIVLYGEDVTGALPA